MSNHEDLRGKIMVTTPHRQKNPHLIVKKPGANEWESIAILKVPIHEFWERLGTALNIKFVDRE